MKGPPKSEKMKMMIQTHYLCKSWLERFIFNIFNSETLEFMCFIEILHGEHQKGKILWGTKKGKVIHKYFSQPKIKSQNCLFSFITLLVRIVRDNNRNIWVRYFCKTYLNHIMYPSRKDVTHETFYYISYFPKLKNKFILK